MLKKSSSRVVWFSFLALLLLASFLFSLFSGSSGMSVRDLFGRGRNVLMHIRLPRALAALFAGAAFSVSGVLSQSILHNRMASPNIIGVNAGSAFTFVLISSLTPYIPGVLSSTFGALLTTALIWNLSRRAGLSKSSIILSGIAVNGILNALMNLVRIISPDAPGATSSFMLGGFSGVTMKSVTSALVFILPALLISLFLAPELNVLELGEDEAKALGVNVSLVRILALFSASVLAGAAVSFSGLLGFVGLLMPHLSRLAAGSDRRVLIPSSALLGSSFVLFCDALSRILFSPYEVPVGLLMSTIGGVFFLRLLLSRRKKDA